MRLLLVLAVAAVAAAGDGARYTKYARMYPDNDNGRFFDATTYGGDIHPTPTTPVSFNRVFRDFVNSKRACSGMFCGAWGAYSCPRRGSTGCLHVEHMVDLNGDDPRFPPWCRRCRSVPGNMIMAAGPWNVAVGGLAGVNYAAAQAEKVSVYGADLMGRAAAAVNACCGATQVPARLAALWPLRRLALASNSTAYDAACDDADECNCDADNDCGCDCDYDDAAAPPPAAKGADESMQVVMLVMLALLSFCGCVACLRTRALAGYEKITEPTPAAP